MYVFKSWRLYVGTSTVKGRHRKNKCRPQSKMLFFIARVAFLCFLNWMLELRIIDRRWTGTDLFNKNKILYVCNYYIICCFSFHIHLYGWNGEIDHAKWLYAGYSSTLYLLHNEIVLTCVLIPPMNAFYIL